jgi:hypothetical protein
MRKLVKSAQPLSMARVRELLDYNAETGAFVWRVARGYNRPGDPAGTINDAGYLTIEIDGKRHRAHRLAWLYVHGSLPPDKIDHQNHARADNRMTNLRLATHLQNCTNLSLRSDNSSGAHGVTWHKPTGKWMAKIRVNKRQIYIGLYADKASAVAARAAAELEHGFHPNHGREVV